MATKIQKIKDLQSGLELAIEKANDKGCEILFSFSFQFEARDLLPLLSHPADKNKHRIYWEQPDKNFALAGLGSVITLDSSDKCTLANIQNMVQTYFENAVHISSHSSVNPLFLGGHAFNLNKNSGDTWKSFPQACFILPECLATLNDDGCWLTVSKLVNPSDEIHSLKLHFERNCMHYAKRLPVILPPLKHIPVDMYKDIPSKSEYKNIIYSVLEKIKPEELEKVVISRSHQVKVGKDFSAISALQVLRNMYPKCTNFSSIFLIQVSFLEQHLSD